MLALAKRHITMLEEHVLNRASRVLMFSGMVALGHLWSLGPVFLTASVTLLLRDLVPMVIALRSLLRGKALVKRF